MIMSQLHSKQQRRVETIKAEVISPTSTSATTAPTLPKVVSPVKSSPIPRPQKTADPLLEKKPRAKHRMVNAYGSSGKAAKTRRCGEWYINVFFLVIFHNVGRRFARATFSGPLLFSDMPFHSESSIITNFWPLEVCTNFCFIFSGECEGCMRDDCGQCAACADKPRFGGRGTKKKACVARICRMRGPPTQGQAIVVQQDQEGQTYQIVGYIASEDIKDWTSRNFT